MAQESVSKGSFPLCFSPLLMESSIVVADIRMGASNLDQVGIKKSRVEISLTAFSALLGRSLLTVQTILPAFWCSLEIPVFFLKGTLMPRMQRKSCTMLCFPVSSVKIQTPGLKSLGHSVQIVMFI